MKRRFNKLSASPALSVLFNVLLYAGLIIMCSMLLSIWLAGCENPAQKIGIASAITVALSSVCGSFIISRINEDKKAQVISILVFSFIIIAISVIFAEGNMKIGGLLNTVIFAFSGLLSLIILKKPQRGRRKIRR